MKRTLTATAAATALVIGLSPAFAQTEAFIPGEQFMLQWDLDSDGKVTLDEARTHRGDIFYMFDTDSNGSFSAEELAGIDEHKLLEQEAGMGPGHNMPEGFEPPAGRGPGQGPGQGMGPGNGGPGNGGQGKGMGPGKGQAQGQAQGQGGAQSGFFQSAQEGMLAFDANGDKVVTQEEFVAGTDGWFAMRDFNRDGVLSVEDFGPRR